MSKLHREKMIFLSFFFSNICLYMYIFICTLLARIKTGKCQKARIYFNYLISCSCLFFGVIISPPPQWKHAKERERETIGPQYPPKPSLLQMAGPSSFFFCTLKSSWPDNSFYLCFFYLISHVYLYFFFIFKNN